MKIWWQSSTPIHRLHDYRSTLTEHLAGVKRPETVVHINGVDDGSMDLHYNAVVAVNSYGPGGVLNKIIQAADQGYDAVAIGCFLDPAMQEARELVPIPVMGLGEASMLTACMFGHKFSGVAFHAKQAQYYDRKAFEYGLSSRHVPFGNMGIDFNQVQTAFTSPEKMTGTFIGESRRLAQQLWPRRLPFRGPAQPAQTDGGDVRLFQPGAAPGHGGGPADGRMVPEEDHHDRRLQGPQDAHWPPRR